MNDNDISKLARIYSLVAKMNLLMVRVEGMKAFNKQQEFDGGNLIYNESHFNDQENCLSKIAEQLDKGGSGG